MSALLAVKRIGEFTRPFRTLRSIDPSTTGWMLFFALLTVLADTFSIAAMAQFLGALGFLAGNAASPLRFLTELNAYLPFSPQMNAAALLFLSMVVQSLSGLRLTLLSARAQSAVCEHMRSEAFSAILRAEWGWIQTKNPGITLNAISGETQKAASAVGYWLQALTQLLTIAAYVALSLLASLKLTLFVGAAGLLLAIAAISRVRKGRSLGLEANQAAERYYGWLSEMLKSLKLVKATATETRIGKVFEGYNRDFVYAERRQLEAPASLRAILEIGSVALLIALLFIAWGALQMSSESTAVVLMVFYRLMPRLITLSQLAQGIATYLPAFEYLKEITRDAQNRRETQGPVAVDRVPPRIELRDVSVQYGPTTALDGFHGTIEAASFVGIVGRSGAGKSTLIDVIAALTRPTRGQILVNGNALEQLQLDSWRSHLGYVGQDTLLVSGTLRENIVWGTDGVKDEVLFRTMKDAGLAEFLPPHPRGPESLVGPGGTSLSGGQRQRVGIARALLRSPSLLILDEATSALDPIVEREILQTLMKLKGKLTILAISHRIQSLQDCDQIWVLEHGKLVAQGNYAQLYETSEVFQNYFTQPEA
jgi:ABC-type multidrug transport system fused ATPase/permease subunit